MSIQSYNKGLDSGAFGECFDGQYWDDIDYQAGYDLGSRVQYPDPPYPEQPEPTCADYGHPPMGIDPQGIEWCHCGTMTRPTILMVHQVRCGIL